MLYLDSSALVKLVVAERESDALRKRVREIALVSSELALAEVPRAVWRTRIGRRRAEQEGLRRETIAVLGRLALVPVTRDLLVASGELVTAALRTLDAIHLGAALTIADELEAAVTYDERQAEAFAAAELPVESPGW